jgi:apolipoprotein N-acyltransferase
VQEAASLDAPAAARGRFGFVATLARAAAPTRVEALWAAASALLLALAFPDFGLWPLAWVGLAPLLYVVARRPSPPQAFVLGLLTGTLFFYASCYWLTYPMIHYAGIPAWLAYPLLLPLTAVGGLFPALFALALARLCRRWGPGALLLAPPLWAAAEWARLGVIGQLWNALGYSQAEVPALIQAARAGGVYAVGFLLLTTNAALAYALARRSWRGAFLSLGALAMVALTVVGFRLHDTEAASTREAPGAVVVAVQPNVIPDFKRPAAEFLALEDEHFRLSAEALRGLEGKKLSGELSGAEELPRVVVWPESPMNFSFANDARFRERVARFNREHRASIIFNSQEPVARGGDYNAAVLVNEEGRLAVQYDKIRLLPFGEYVPLPSWVPGANFVRGVVGDFTPGTRYTLMPLGGEGGPRAGVFICVESAYPSVTRQFAREGADVLIEITNDAYQGDTAVLRQHLANAVFRAVETGRPVLRVTNTGITARVTPDGRVSDAAEKLRPAVRVWAASRAAGGQTFYVRHGDIFAALCAAASALALLLSWRRPKLLSA